MHTMTAPIEAILTEIVVLTLQTVKTLAFDGLVHIGALVAEVLLGEYFIDFTVV